MQHGGRSLNPKLYRSEQMVLLSTNCGRLIDLHFSNNGNAVEKADCVGKCLQ
jgi:hypothetical protein